MTVTCVTASGEPVDADAANNFLMPFGTQGIAGRNAYRQMAERCRKIDGVPLGNSCVVPVLPYFIEESSNKDDIQPGKIVAGAVAAAALVASATAPVQGALPSLPGGIAPGPGSAPPPPPPIPPSPLVTGASSAPSSAPVAQVSPTPAPSPTEATETPALAPSVTTTPYEVAVNPKPTEQPIYYIGKDLPIDSGEPNAPILHKHHFEQPGNAPADESFGHIHMSVLGMRNFLAYTDSFTKDMQSDVARDLLHKMLFVEDCFRDWQAKYPHDTWIVKLGLELNESFAKLDAALPNDNPHVAALHRINLADFMDKNYPANSISSK